MQKKRHNGAKRQKTTRDSIESVIRDMRTLARDVERITQELDRPDATPTATRRPRKKR